MTDKSDVITLPAVSGSIYNSLAAFQDGQRIANALAASSLVPQDYRGNVANTLVALEMAQRTGSSPMAVMQNMHVIHGRPSWSSQFVIAALNSCGRFGPLRFKMSGAGDDQTCIAWAIDRSNGEELEGPPVSIRMAKDEGWYSKNGSKWKTMPELMLRYRAAKFFGNLYAPDVLMGMHAADEVEDFAGPAPVSQPDAPAQRVRSLNIPVDPAPAAHEQVIHGEVVDPEPQPEPKSTRKRQQPEPQPQPEPEPPARDEPPATDDNWGF